MLWTGPSSQEATGPFTKGNTHANNNTELLTILILPSVSTLLTSAHVNIMQHHLVFTLRPTEMSTPHSLLSVSVSGLLCLHHSSLLSGGPQHEHQARLYIRFSVLRQIQSADLQLPVHSVGTRQWTL